MLSKLQLILHPVVHLLTIGILFLRGGLLWTYFTELKHHINKESDNYAELIAEYRNHKIVDKESSNQDTANILKNSQDLLESVSDLLNHSNKVKQQQPIVQSYEPKEETFEEYVNIESDEIDGCWSEGCVRKWELPESIILKYAAELVIALESLHRIGVIC